MNMKLEALWTPSARSCRVPEASPIELSSSASNLTRLLQPSGVYVPLRGKLDPRLLAQPFHRHLIYRKEKAEDTGSQSSFPRSVITLGAPRSPLSHALAQRVSACCRPGLEVGPGVETCLQRVEEDRIGALPSGLGDRGEHSIGEGVQ